MSKQWLKGWETSLLPTDVVVEIETSVPQDKGSWEKAGVNFSVPAEWLELDQ